jgi:[ribosomal protein S18]-alanine N-acetyltransferase
MAKVEVLALRKLSPQHLDALMEIDHRCFGGHWSRDTYQRELASSSGHFIGRFHQQELVGMGCFWSILDEAHITLMAVLPEYRGRGWGKDILVGLLAEAVAIGMNHATLEVRISNTIALQLYAKMGFEALGQRKKYYQNPEEDAIIMWCRGLQQANFMGRYAHC